MNPEGNTNEKKTEISYSSCIAFQPRQEVEATLFCRIYSSRDKSQHRDPCFIWTHTHKSYIIAHLDGRSTNQIRFRLPFDFPSGFPSSSSPSA